MRPFILCEKNAIDLHRWPFLCVGLQILSYSHQLAESMYFCAPALVRELFFKMSHIIATCPELCIANSAARSFVVVKSRVFLTQLRYAHYKSE